MPPRDRAGIGEAARTSCARADGARSGCRGALEAGWKILSQGGSALDAVEAAVVVMEDSPHFNAGHGAALTADSTHELDASIMDGKTGLAGAVAGVTTVMTMSTRDRRLMASSRSLTLGCSRIAASTAVWAWNSAGKEILNSTFSIT